jgi:hypothetical protein
MGGHRRLRRIRVVLCAARDFVASDDAAVRRRLHPSQADELKGTSWKAD